MNNVATLNPKRKKKEKKNAPVFKSHTRRLFSSIHSCVLVYIRFSPIVSALPLLLEEPVANCLNKKDILIKYLDAAGVFIKSVENLHENYCQYKQLKKVSIVNISYTPITNLKGYYKKE